MGRKHLTRILALGLALTMLSTAAVAAASFPDLEGHWAKDYMIELYEMDYLKGYNDNTMRPDTSITGATALTMLSRLFEVDDEAREMAREEYGTYAEEVVPAAQSWLNDEDVIAICLAGGVVPADELEALIDAGGLEGSLTREYLSVLFVRAMGLEEKAQDIETVELSFTDTESITAARRPYVQVLYETGVIEGNADNTFSPKSSVTRAAVAAMFSRAVNYMKDNGGLPTLEQCTGMEKFKGVIQDVTTTTVTLRNLQGVEYVLDLSKTLEVTADGTSVSSLSTSYEGKYAELYFDMEDQTVARVAVYTKSTWIQGILKTSDTSSLSIVNSNDNSTKSYLFDADDTAFYYEGKSIPKSSLSRGSYVSVKMGDARLEEVQAFPSEYTLEGEMEEIIYGTTCTLTAIDENGARFQISFPISETPEISRGGITYTDGLTRLQKGDWLEVTIRSDEVKSIATDTDAKTEKVEGTVSSISQTSDGYYLTVEDAGETTRYQLSPYVTVTEDKKTAALSDLQVGDSVTLSLSGNVITDIVIEEAATNTDSFTGKVLLVDTTARQILVQDESLIYVNTKGATIVSSTGGSITLSSIKEGNTVMIYGSWVSNTELDATLITVIG